MGAELQGWSDKSVHPAYLPNGHLLTRIVWNDWLKEIKPSVYLFYGV